MKKNSVFVILICSLFFNCTKNATSKSWNIGEGVEIYLTKIPKTNDYSIDYINLKLDTIALEGLPIIRYNDIKSYKKSAHTITLNINSDEVNSDIKSVFGRMFIITVDKKPIYCGFMWPLTSSATCSHVFILEKLVGADGNKNEITINFTNPSYPDPRSDVRIIDRLKKDEKLTE
jgi:hypothetical protein